MLFFLITVILEPEQSVQYAVDEIKNNTFLNFNDLEKLWKETVNYRLNSIQKSNSTKEIMEMWKSYSLPHGFRLVSLTTLFTYFTKIHPKP